MEQYSWRRGFTILAAGTLYLFAVLWFNNFHDYAYGPPWTPPYEFVLILFLFQVATPAAGVWLAMAATRSWITQKPTAKSAYGEVQFSTKFLFVLILICAVFLGLSRLFVVRFYAAYFSLFVQFLYGFCCAAFCLIASWIWLTPHPTLPRVLIAVGLAIVIPFAPVAVVSLLLNSFSAEGLRLWGSMLLIQAIPVCVSLQIVRWFGFRLRQEMLPAGVRASELDVQAK
jgi:hypothetical protein